MKLSGLLIAGLSVVLIAGTTDAVASVQFVGGSLLTQTYADQLGTWLNEGDLTITNIFTKQTGDDSLDFHAAADGKGRTFTVMEVLSGVHVQTGTPFTTSEIIGGYNPQSWDSSGTYHITTPDAARTAFIFNLTSTEIQKQSLTTQTGSAGQYQTVNPSSFGPTFGGGYDIWTSANLASGEAYNYSYGGTVTTNNILSGMSYFDTQLVYGRIEVFTITNGLQDAATPEPFSLMVWVGLIAATVINTGRRTRS